MKTIYTDTRRGLESALLEKTLTKDKMRVARVFIACENPECEHKEGG